MRNVLRGLKPNEFEDIVAVNSLYRPDRWNKFQPLLNQNMEKKIEYLHPDLKPILERTYGVIVYQEQIMQIASSWRASRSEKPIYYAVQ